MQELLMLLLSLCGVADAYRSLRLQPPIVPYVQRVRESECAGGAPCMFVLACLMGGGTAAAPCPGILSTCCRKDKPAEQGSYRDIFPTEQLYRDGGQTPADDSSAEDKEPASECGVSSLKPQSRIIGGSDASYGEFPWQAHIKLDRQQCGGVLLNRHYVLTAAHCIHQVGVSEIRVQLGVHDIQDPSRHDTPPQELRVTHKLVHPQFEYRAAHPDRFDVALLRLSPPGAALSAAVRPVCLPRAPPTPGGKAVVTGWGKTDAKPGSRFGTRLLQKASVPIVSNAQCEAWHAEKGIDVHVAPEMMCAGYEEGKKDACVGDSGGPLLTLGEGGRWFVAGLVSAGFGCAQSRQPGIYHRVHATADWLRDAIAR